MNSNKGSPQLTYKPANFDDISKRDNDPDVLVKGKLQYLKGKKEETVYYIIKKIKQQIRCYKHEQSTKVCRKFNLKGARLLADQPVQDTTTLNVILKSGRVVALLDFKHESKQELVKLFQEGDSKISPTKTFFKNFKKGCTGLVKAPIKISSGTITVLEKIGDGARKAPDVLFAKQNSLQAKKAKRTPQNPAQGLLYGAESIITEVAGALVGLVSEPMKGAKKRGFKGATTGLGRGIVGLIFKPVAGTIDLVTHTARGVGTVPSAIYKNVFKIKSKKQKENSRVDPKEAEKNDLELVFEDDKQQVFVNKKSLNKNVLPTEKLKSLNEIDTAALDYKEKYELEREKREQLAKLMENIISSLDKEALTKNMDLINQALKMSEIEEDEKEESNSDAHISRVISYYEGQNPNNDTQEELYEFFFVQAVSPRNKSTSKRNTARLSIQTNSFDDKPSDERGFRIPKDTNESYSDSSVSSAYEDNHVMNQNISAYDSDGFDGDEFKSDEVRVAYSLASHTGREGRNGPMSIISPELTPKKTPFYGKVLDLEQEEAMCGLTLGNKEAIKGVPLFSHQSSLRDPAAQSKQFLMSRSSFSPEEAIDLANMHQLIDLEAKPKITKKWTYPQVNINLPYKEIEDLPNCIRLKDFDVPGREYCSLKGKELAQFLENWKFLENKEDARYPYTNKKGGKIPENEQVTKKIRTIAKEFIMKVGRSVLSGNFNLTTIPFPIKASVPKSYLENIGYTPTVYFPLYLNLAMRNPDPLQRFKFYIVSSLSYFFLTTPFAKPLNPILGETLTGYHVDGGRAYLEQISHHPPISYLLYHGPKDAYKVWGPSMFGAHAGLNSLSITTKGWRKIEFADTKQIISNTFPNEYYEGSFWGTFYTETVGTMEFEDKENKIFCQLKFGSLKKKPSDYFEGTILVNGKAASTVTGTCLGWIEIDGFRYFDYRFSQPFLMQTEASPIWSDFKYRRDYLTLKLGHIEEAQKEKDALEQLQRNDNKLRKEKHDKGHKHKGK